MKQLMKARFKLVCLGNRGGMFYCKDTKTGSRKSLETRNRTEAEKLVFHKNEAEDHPHITRRVGMAYLSSSDPELCQRTWRTVMDDIIKDKTGATLHRYETAAKDPAYALIADLLLVETRPADFMEVLRSGTVSTNVYLRRYQNYALDMDWLPKRVLPRRKFPKVKYGEKRAITWEEHNRVVAREGNPERRDFYDLCYYLGGSQSDIAGLHAEDVDYENRSFCYHIKPSSLPRMIELLQQIHSRWLTSEPGHPLGDCSPVSTTV